LLFVSQRNPAEAKSRVAAAIYLDPEHHRAHFIMGVLLAEEGNPDEAEKHFRRAAESPDPRIRQMASDELSKLEGGP
jgi:Tfp pilus assembly protein PilF